MVRFSTLALVLISVSSAIARPSHHRRQRVCRSQPASAVQTTASASASSEPSSKPVLLAEITSSESESVASKSSSVRSSSASATSKASTKTSSVEPQETGNTDDEDGGVVGGTSGARALFPVGSNLRNVWSCSKDVDGTLPLSMGTLNAYKGTKSINVVQFGGKTAIEAKMLQGSISPGNKNGPAPPFSFYARGPTSLAEGDEVLFSYSVFFEDGFEFNKGGKLPGVFGGTDENIAATCSGGRHDPRCWSARLMWRENGVGEFYAYLPQGEGNNDNKCGKAANGPCESEYGSSIGRGTWIWETGKWITVAERVKLNAIGQQDGEAEVFINGRSVLKVTGLVYRTSAASKVRGAQMQIFFGGHTKEWACPKTQNVYFADLSAAIIA